MIGITIAQLQPFFHPFQLLLLPKNNKLDIAGALLLGTAKLPLLAASPLICISPISLRVILPIQYASITENRRREGETMDFLRFGGNLACHSGQPFRSVTSRSLLTRKK